MMIQTHLQKSTIQLVKKLMGTLSISIFLDDENGNWYLKQNYLVYNDTRYHNNHIWKSPSHLQLSEFITPDLISQCIDNRIQCCMNIPNI